MNRAERIVAWLRERVAAAGAGGLVVGLSGGIDSSLVAVLSKRAFADASLGVVLSCHSLASDGEHARLAARACGLAFVEVPLEPVYDTFLAQLGEGGEGEGARLARANLKPRLRMAALYFQANRRGYLVAGTGNRSELELGYFTKYGDGGVDLLPLGRLVKSEVRELARQVGVPEEIIAKPPSAGLWEGQTDETEMGLSYADLDRYLLAGEAQPEVRRRVEALRAASEHKRQLPPVGPA